MSYPLKSKPKRELLPKIVTAILLFVVFSLVNYFFSERVKIIAYYLSKPVWKISEVTQKPFVYISRYFSTKSSLIEENKILKEALARLELKENDYDLIRKENDELRGMLGREENRKKILASIVAKPPQSPYDTFLIDVGTSNGVTLGSKAYISERIIVGVVKESHFKTSTVELFSTQGNALSVVLERTGNTYTLVGQGGGNYKLDVPKDTDLVWGDAFVYPGTISALVGVVYFIDSNTQSAFKTAYIRAPVNTFAYRELLIEPVE